MTMERDKKGKRPFVGKTGVGTKPSFIKKGFQPVSDSHTVSTQARSLGHKNQPPLPDGEVDERIAKRLARAGIASRREAESMIVAGRISVNGKILTSPVVNVSREDIICVDGKKLPPIERTRLWLYHKPTGLVTTTRDEQGRPTVFAHLPEGLPRVISVGRLDINTEGLLLLTNDGGLARILELPATGWLRRYRVRAHGRIAQADLAALKDGIAIDGVFYGGIDADIEREQGSNVWLSVALREGKNREVKNILAHLGLEVARLIRVSYGPFQLADIKAGEVREIKGRTLREQLGERLVAASNANFDAPILTHMPQKAPSSPPRQDGEKNKTARRQEWISSSAAKPRQFKGKGLAKQDENQEPSPRKIHNKSNNTNVWMAPGNRPLGKNKNKRFGAVMQTESETTSHKKNQAFKSLSNKTRTPLKTPRSR